MFSISYQAKSPASNGLSASLDPSPSQGIRLVIVSQCVWGAGQQPPQNLAHTSYTSRSFRLEPRVCYVCVCGSFFDNPWLLSLVACLPKKRQHSYMPTCQQHPGLASAPFRLGMFSRAHVCVCAKSSRESQCDLVWHARQRNGAGDVSFPIAVH